MHNLDFGDENDVVILLAGLIIGFITTQAYNFRDLFWSGQYMDAFIVGMITFINILSSWVVLKYFKPYLIKEPSA